MTEFWELITENKASTGIKHRRGDKIPEGFYHLVVHSWIICPEGYFLMSQRQEHRAYALKWERTGGSVLFGESSLEGAKREVFEELGIDLSACTGHFIKSQKREKYHDFYDSWLFIVDKNTAVSLQNSEVKTAKWLTLEEVDALNREKKLVKSSCYYREVYERFKKIIGKA